jgi:hypothetical protein
MLEMNRSLTIVDQRMLQYGYIVSRYKIIAM